MNSIVVEQRNTACCNGVLYLCINIADTRSRTLHNQCIFCISSNTLGYHVLPGPNYSVRVIPAVVEYKHTQHVRLPTANDAPPQFSPHVSVVPLLQLSKESILYDLGCGDGRLLTEAVKVSGARGVSMVITIPLSRVDLRSYRGCPREKRKRCRQIWPSNP